MRITAWLTIALWIALSNAYAQNPIETKTNYNERTKSYEILVDNRSQSSYVVKITFTELDNLKCKDGNRSFTKTVYPGKRTLTTLKRKDDSRGTRFNYKVWSHPGKYKPKVKMDFPYLLPLKNGKQTSCTELTYLYDQYGAISPPQGWYAITLKTEVGDTIYAARKGTVCTVKDKFSDPQKGILYSSKSNGLTIEHKDGSFADYQLFQDEGIFVEEGQLVLPGQALGIIGGENYASGSHLRFSVRYYHEHDKLIEGDKKSDEKFYWAYVPIQFYTENGPTKLEQRASYEVIHDLEVMKKEMSKKEKKQFHK